MFNQSDYDIKLEWGLKGIETLVPVSDVIIIVDVLSFSTCVDIAVSNGAAIFPYRYKDESAKDFARSVDVELASFKRSITNYSLSPASLVNISKDTKLVLPSPNGATLSLATGDVPTLCGCLRNAKTVAEYAMTLGKNISVIPAGEKWKDDYTIRFAIEDYLGAGAVISYLKGSFSPESKSALNVFKNLPPNLKEEIKNCSSGRELIDIGFGKDVDLACELNVSSAVPVLKEGSYVSAVK